MVSVLIVIILVTAYVFSRPTTVTLPDYLNRCIPPSGPFVYTSAPQLELNVTGRDVLIPAGIGVSRTCLRPLSTVDPSGVIHIVSDVDRNYTLRDFFLLWGYTSGPDYAIFNQNQVLNYKAVGGHAISMDVNGAPSNSFENFIFPRNSSGRVGYHFTLIAIYYS
jgi:hypothetical protein